MDVPKQMSEDRIGGPEAAPQRASGFTRGSGGRQPNAGAVSAPKRGPFRGAPQADCLIPKRAYLVGHDGPFPLPKYLRGTAGELLRPRGADAGHRAPADQAEPAPGHPAR